MEKPLIMAHKGGDYFSKENSLKAVKKSLEIGVAIIELNIRKSSDGVIFCYHGNIIESLFPRLSFNKPFNKLKNKYQTLITLKEAVEAINNKAEIFLDIKDCSINLEEIKEDLRKNKKRTYLASNSLRFHKKLGTYLN